MRFHRTRIFNTEEEFYSGYELYGEGWIRKILMQDLHFYYPTKTVTKDMIPAEQYAERDDFINFLCIQYFRTCEMRDTITKNISNMLKLAESAKDLSINIKNINPENILPHMIWIFQTNCAAKLIHMNAHMTVLINDTTLLFITSDQPIINKESSSEDGDEEPKEFVLYYPLCPTVAITVNDSNRCTTKHIDKKSIIDDYNRKIIEHSYEYLVANKEAVLHGIIEMDS